MRDSEEGKRRDRDGNGQSEGLKGYQGQIGLFLTWMAKETIFRGSPDGQYIVFRKKFPPIFIDGYGWAEEAPSTSLPIEPCLAREKLSFGPLEKPQ